MNKNSYTFFKMCLISCVLVCIGLSLISNSYLDFFAGVVSGIFVVIFSFIFWFERQKLKMLEMFNCGKK